jgi:hypothetical protein
MKIEGKGWELLVKRLGMQRKEGLKRTYGSYQVYREGMPVEDLSGFMCETVGPGDNTRENNGKRIEAGRYPLWTQFGRYRSIGYSQDLHKVGAVPMPGLLLLGTGKRTGILIHPGHPPHLYLSSIGCFNPTGALRSDQAMNFWDSRARAIALIDELRRFAPNAFASTTTTRISGASVVVDGEPTQPLRDTPEMALEMVAVAREARVETQSLPISKAAAITCARWLLENFGEQLAQATKGKPYKVKHLCAIVCQETAYKWLKWVGEHDARTIIERCVFDASGDYPDSPRSAFPKNTAAFRAKYGAAFTDMLIEEANKTRRMQGYADKPWVYKGYGIFQYDLQNVKTDEAFFRNKAWYRFEDCLAACCNELDAKIKTSANDLWTAIRKYNGSGPGAERYVANVKVFTRYCAEVTDA